MVNNLSSCGVPYVGIINIPLTIVSKATKRPEHGGHVVWNKDIDMVELLEDGHTQISQNIELIKKELSKVKGIVQHTLELVQLGRYRDGIVREDVKRKRKCGGNLGY